MKHRSFNYSTINSTRSRKRRNNRRANTKTKHLFKGALFIVSLAVVLFGLKLLISPVVGAIASMMKESSVTISYMLNKGDIKKVNDITNFLILGVDERYEGGPSLTDTIMILSYNHKTKSTVMISLPRDLWVQIPAFDGVSSYFTKINSVYSVGEKYGYKSDEKDGIGGGAGLLSEVIENHIGVPIQYYAKINFDGFRELIDIVGGVDIYVERAFTDYQYPREGYEDAPEEMRNEIVSFEQGWQHMDGETALKYARSRHALGPEGSDFARAKRQQKVVMALKDKLVSNDTIFNLDRLRNIYLTLSNKFDTNVSVTELPLLYKLAEEQAKDLKITSVVLDSGYGEEGLLYTPDPAQYGGAFVLIPRGGWPVIEDYINSKIYPAPQDDSNE